MSDSLRCHELQHVRLPCPSLSPRVCSNSCPLSHWYYLTISFSSSSFSSCLQFFPVSGSFPMSWLFTTDGQSIGASTSTSVLPMNIHGWFPLGLTGLISMQSQGLSRVFSSTIWKHQFLSTQPSLWFNFHTHTWLLEKNIALTIWIFVGKMLFLLFNTLSGFVSFQDIFVSFCLASTF